MKTHSLPSSESRASADSHRGSGVSMPAAQRYTTQDIEQQLHRVSDNTNMAVRATGRPADFYANANALTAAHVLNQNGGGPQGMNIYTPNVDFDNDCGGYANNILRKMHAVNPVTHTTYKKTKNAQQEIEVPFNTVLMFGKALTGLAAPNLGEIYMAVNDPADLIENEDHYNFHWAVVVAQDGNDVITLESDLQAQDVGWFRMYNHYKQSQTFRHHYVFTVGMLADAATVFGLTYHQRLRVQQPQQAEVILDSDDDDVIVID